MEGTLWRRWRRRLFVPLVILVSLTLMASEYGAEDTSSANKNGTNTKAVKKKDNSRPSEDYHGCSLDQVNTNQELGKKILAEMFPKWSWADLKELWWGESKWCHLAKNRQGSSAYGIAQFLDGTWKPYGKRTSDPKTQIRYGLRYIKDKYKTATAANKFKKRKGWY